MRIRSIKPEFFKDEELGDLHPLTRLFFIGLWCSADSNGILEHRPSRLAIDILPYDILREATGKQLGNTQGEPEKQWGCPRVEQMISQLRKGGWITLYSVDGKEYLSVNNWHKHQRITGKEATNGGRFPPMDQGFVIDDCQENQRGNNGETPGKHPDAQEQGTGNREQGTGSREQGKELSPLEAGVTDSKPKSKAKYTEEFESFWLELRELPNGIRASDNKGNVSKRFAAIRSKGLTPDEIVLARRIQIDSLLANGTKPQYIQGVEPFMASELNVRQHLDEGPVIQVDPRQAQIERVTRNMQARAERGESIFDSRIDEEEFDDQKRLC